MTNEIKNRIEQIKNGVIPAGYMRTKVGIVPREWEVKKLGEVGEFTRGKNISTSDLKSDGVCKAIMYGDIYIKYDTKFYDVDFRINSEQAKLSTPIIKGHLLFTSSGETAIEIGKCVTYQGDSTVYIGGDILALKPTKDNSLFLSYQQNHFCLIKVKARLGQGHSVVHIYQTPLSKINISLPPLPEQQRIADILSLQDRVIELKEKLIEQKEKQKKYLMQNLLTGKIRLKGFNGEWEKVKLNTLLTETKKRNVKQNLLICSVAVQKGVISQIEHLGRSYAASDTSNYNVVSFGDLIYTKSPTGDFPYGIIKQSQLSEDVAVSPLYGVYKPVSYGLGYILHSYFQYPINTNNYLTPIVQKGAKNTINISNETFISNILYLPLDIPEQTAIADILSTADREIELLKQDLAEERQKKKALMQLLLTGIVRVQNMKGDYHEKAYSSNYV